MDSPSSPVQIADRDTLVSLLSTYLPRETIRTLGAASSEYESSVLTVSEDKLLMKRRVENEIGEEITLQESAKSWLNTTYKHLTGIDTSKDNHEHDWALTYDLLTTMPVALHYTGSDIDRYIVEKKGTPKSHIRDQGDLITAAREGHVNAFRVLHYYTAQTDKLNYPQDDERFVRVAIQRRHLGILDLPEMITCIQEMQPTVVEKLILDGMVASTSPRVLDFFLSLARLDGIKFENRILRQAISRGIRLNMVGLMRVLVKHNLVDPDPTGSISSPLQTATSNGYLEMVGLLLPAVQGREALINLQKAVSRGFVDVVRLILDNGLGGSDDYLANAVDSGNVEMVKLILSYPGHVKKISPATLLEAADNNYTEIFLMLLADPRLKPDVATLKDAMVSAKYNSNTEMERTIRLYG